MPSRSFYWKSPANIVTGIFKWSFTTVQWEMPPGLLKK